MADLKSKMAAANAQAKARLQGELNDAKARGV
jgi:hypothetical protein